MMSTLMNYTYQSFNFRDKSRLKPFYDLVANIAAEEYGHIEAVAATINSLLTGATARPEPGQQSPDSPLNDAIPEARKFNEEGVHRTLYRFSPDDYVDVDKIWKGRHWEDGGELRVVHGTLEGAPVPSLDAEPQVYAPGYHPEELEEISRRILRRA